MALNNGTADAMATAFCAAQGITAPNAIAAWKLFAETLYTHLKADIDIIIAATSITTNGSATTQVGPPAPITINPA
jgi:hypothetical protein